MAVSLNVGGRIYTTTSTTLQRYNSKFSRMFGPGGLHGSMHDDHGNCFIDRDGDVFRHILNFLRTSELVLPDDFKELDLLEREAKFYQIKELVDAIAAMKEGKHRCLRTEVHV
ncbi:BTB/POZ domain-containing protein KCTD6-like [Amphiura filiformis]|uniref:BTB/POZ domain-containing protein KCTD6-like n=1 Tax=Amphiura filiformis TaxID=82378 RepID=UPI003B212961